MDTITVGAHERPKVGAPRKVFFILFLFDGTRASIATQGLSLVAVSGGYSSLQWAGFSLQWLLLLWNTGSRICGLQ